MAFSRPTLTQLRDRVEADYIAGLSLTTILLRSFIKVFAAIVAGVSHTLHGHIQDFIQIQFFPDTAEEEFLIRWANIFGLTRLEATFAELNITITGTDTSVIPIDTVYQRVDGLEYKTKAEVVIGTTTPGEVAAIIVAEDAGDAGNIDDGSTVSLTSPITGVDSDATVDSTSVEGEDQETIEQLRTRLLQRIQQPPAGGKVTDYIAFALSVVGVTRVFILPGFLGQGTVGVTFVEDGEDPIIPSVAKVEEVQIAVDEQKPVTADAIVFAPTASPIDPEIQLKPNTTEVRTAVIAELEDMIFREAKVRDAVDPDQVAAGVTFDGKISLSKITEAISLADGEDAHVLLSPTSDPQPPSGGLLILGTPVFSTLP